MQSSQALGSTFIDAKPPLSVGYCDWVPIIALQLFIGSMELDHHSFGWFPIDQDDAYYFMPHWTCWTATRDHESQADTNPQRRFNSVHIHRQMLQEMPHELTV